MLTGIGCCSVRLKGSEYRADGGPGCFPFVRRTGVSFSERLFVVAASSSGRSAVCVGTTDVVFLGDFALHQGGIDDSASKLSVNLATKVAKLYPFVDLIQLDQEHSAIFLLGHSGLGCSAHRLSFSVNNNHPVVTECLTSPHTIFESDSFSCAVRLQSVPAVIIGTSQGTVYTVSLGSDFGRVINSFEPGFSVKSPSISDMTSDTRFLYISTDEVPEIIVYACKEGSPDLTQIQLINLTIPSVIFPIQVKSIMRPFSSLARDSLDKPSGSLYVRTDRLIARYSFESSSVVTFEVYDTHQLFFGPFDNGPVMSIDEDCVAVWENVCGRLRRSSQMHVNGILQVAVSRNRDQPGLFVLTQTDDGKFYLETWDPRGSTN